MKPQHWTDRAAAAVSPMWGLKRARARIALNGVRNYEAASVGRRTSNWYRTNTDANAALGPALAYIRATSRDLVRNSGYAESALSTIVDHTVGWGIEAKTLHPAAAAAWKAWAGSTDCDADNRHDFAGLQGLVMRTVVESGECLVRRRWRRTEDGFTLPMQLQVIEPDFLDTSKSSTGINPIIQGVEFDAIGRRAFYWLFREHPGSNRLTASGSYRVPASDVIHVFRNTRAGQVRAASWFAPVLLRFKDFDELADATLMKQKIAACLAVITSDVDGTGTALGTSDDTEDPPQDSLGPGMILNVKPGRSVDVVNPPSVNEYGEFSESMLREIFAGLGVSFEDATGNYTKMSFSAARMSMIRHWKRVDNWRWKMLIPQFCGPSWAWAMDAMRINGVITGERPSVRWTAPPPPMIDPVNEGLAFARLVRVGAQSLSESLRERGYDPDEVFAEMAADNTRLDALGLVLDSDPRQMTQAGQLQGSAIAQDQKADEIKKPNPPTETADE